MEDGNSLGNLLAQGVIILFVLLLLVLFIRTGLMVGSVFFLAWTRRREKAASPASLTPPTAAPEQTGGIATTARTPRPEPDADVDPRP